MQLTQDLEISKQKYHLKFRIDDLPQTMNSIGRKHWWAKAKEAKRWKWLVGLRVASQLPSEPIVKASLTLTRHSSHAPDADGLVSSFKHVIDGLVDAGVILDDRLENIGMPNYKWAKGKVKQGYITVEVQEL